MMGVEKGWAIAVRDPADIGLMGVTGLGQALGQFQATFEGARAVERAVLKDLKRMRRQ